MSAIDMAPVVAALNGQPDGMPHVERTFRSYLAKRLGDRLMPEGIAMCLMLLAYDLADGKSGFASMPLPRELIGLPSMAYAVMMVNAKHTILNAVPDASKEAVRAALGLA